MKNASMVIVLLLTPTLAFAQQPSAPPQQQISPSEFGSNLTQVLSRVIDGITQLSKADEDMIRQLGQMKAEITDKDKQIADRDRRIAELTKAPSAPAAPTPAKASPIKKKP